MLKKFKSHTVVYFFALFKWTKHAPFFFIEKLPVMKNPNLDSILNDANCLLWCGVIADPWGF